MAGHKQKRSPKKLRYGCKQAHGHSRAAYFAQARVRIAKNKARRIARELKRQEKKRERALGGVARHRGDNAGDDRRDRRIDVDGAGPAQVDCAQEGA
jgi:hypothetical protein